MEPDKNKIADPCGTKKQKGIQVLSDPLTNTRSLSSFVNFTITKNVAVIYLLITRKFFV